MLVRGDSAEKYKAAIGLREIASVQQIEQLPRSPLALYGPGTYRPSRAKKVNALQNYLRIVKFLLPSDKSITSACLWHSDLHAENIFVHPERPTEVLGIIDWQSSEILPLIDHARQPYFIDYEGPMLTDLEPPAFPENYDQLDAAGQEEAQKLYFHMSLAALYRRLTYNNNELLFKAMQFRLTTSFDIMLLAQIYSWMEKHYINRGCLTWKQNGMTSLAFKLLAGRRSPCNLLMRKLL